MLSATTPQCAYVGLGAMGKSMAGHIAKKLATLSYPPLLAFNRTQARAEELKETHPIKIATDLSQVASSSDIIFSCLLNDDVVKETIDNMKPHLKPGTILVESSTISPRVAQKLANDLKQSDITYLACPVLGPPVSAASGNLLVMVAGSMEARSKILPLLIPVIGKKAIELGEDVTESLRLKLCANFFATSIVEMLAEGMTLGQGTGLGQEKIKELIDCTIPGSIVDIYATRMMNNTYRNQIAFPLSGIKKDVNHIIQMANEAGVSLPTTEIFLENVNKAQAEQGDIDITGVVGVLREKANLDFDLKKKGGK